MKEKKNWVNLENNNERKLNRENFLLWKGAPLRLHPPHYANCVSVICEQRLGMGVLGHYMKFANVGVSIEPGLLPKLQSFSL